MTRRRIADRTGGANDGRRERAGRTDFVRQLPAEKIAISV
jgi:hypothetical protein